MCGYVQYKKMCSQVPNWVMGHIVQMVLEKMSCQNMCFLRFPYIIHVEIVIFVLFCASVSVGLILKLLDTWLTWLSFFFHFFTFVKVLASSMFSCFSI